MDGEVEQLLQDLLEEENHVRKMLRLFLALDTLVEKMNNEPPAEICSTAVPFIEEHFASPKNDTALNISNIQDKPDASTWDFVSQADCSCLQQQE